MTSLPSAFFFHQKPRQQCHAAADLRRANAHVEGFETRAVVAVFGVVALTVEPVMPGLGREAFCSRTRSVSCVGSVNGSAGRLPGAQTGTSFAEQLQAFGAGP
jgi:hypothetical protein